MDVICTCPKDFVVKCPDNPSNGDDGVLDKNDCGCDAELIVAPGTQFNRTLLDNETKIQIP